MLDPVPPAKTSWFEPLFGKRVQSLYRDDCSITKYLTQLSVLGSHVDNYFIYIDADSRSGELVVLGKVEQHQYQPYQSDTGIYN